MTTVKDISGSSEAGGKKKRGSTSRLEKSAKKVSEVKLEEQNKYEEKMISVIDGIEEKIKLLKENSDGFAETAKQKIDEQVDYLSGKKGELQVLLGNFRKNPDKKWEEVKEVAGQKMEVLEAEARQLFKGLKGGIAHALSKFRSKK